jgi:hypothetical protein
MARWGTFKWGDGTKWGALGVTRQLTWSLEIDWDGDGLFNGANEGRYLRGLTTRRGRRYLLRSDNQGFEPVMVGEATFTLLNDSRRFDPYYAGGPLYGLILPGRKFRLRVKDEASGIVYPVMAGYVEDILPQSGEVEEVRLACVDGGRDLSGNDIVITLREGIGSDEAIALALEAAEWSGGTSIEATTDVLTYWWAAGRSARAEIDDLTDAGLGKFFVAADGTATYYSRNHLYSATITILETDILKSYGIRMPQPWEAVRNEITVRARPRTVVSATELWRMQDKPQLPAGAALEIWAEFMYSNKAVPAKNVITPVATTDYTVNTASDGSGTNLTSQCTVTMYTYADRCILSIYNGSVSNGYITLLKVRGDAITALHPSTIRRSNAASIAIYRKRVFTLDTDWLQDTNAAVTIADTLEAMLGDARDFPSVMMRGVPEKQFDLELFDRAALSFPSRWIARALVCACIEHASLDTLCNVIETKVSFEPTIEQASDVYWQFPTQIGVDSIFAS